MSKKDPNKTKISLSWSGGKDSAFALWLLQKQSEFEVVRLHTTFGQETKRVGLHGIKEKLIEKQAASIGLPVDKLYYPASGDNQAYENTINSYLDQLEEKDIYHIAFGDIFLEDLRSYREKQLAARGFKAIFPLWGKDTRTLALEFLQAGFQTLICAADADKIDQKWMGKIFSQEFLENLAPSVDFCGENGEFHTFCYNGPVFSMAIPVHAHLPESKSYEIRKEDGEVLKKYYWFSEMEVK